MAQCLDELFKRKLHIILYRHNVTTIFGRLQSLTDRFSAPTGPCVILIGPVDGLRHCEPEPDYLENSDEWEIMEKISLSGEDAIAVYTKQNKV